MLVSSANKHSSEKFQLEDIKANAIDCLNAL